jgi:uroporphyrinogen-III decarboxylase
MAATSRELVKALFIGKPVGRAPFIPLLATAASQYMQTPVRTIFSDPTALANALQSCHRLFRYDGVPVLFDPTLEAEACGCTLSWREGQPPQIAGGLPAGALASLDIDEIIGGGRIPIILEAAKRLTVTLGRDAALMGVITGPATLSRQLMGDAFKSAAECPSDEFRKTIDLSGEIALALLRAYGELKMDAIVLADPELASLLPDRWDDIQSVLRTLRNLAGFYDMPLILQTGDIPPDSLQAFFRLEADAFAPGNPVSDLTGQRPSGAVLGASIPPAALLGSPEDVNKSVLDLANLGSGPYFVTTQGEIPAGTPAAQIHEAMRALAAKPL